MTYNLILITMCLYSPHYHNISIIDKLSRNYIPNWSNSLKVITNEKLKSRSRIGLA